MKEESVTDASLREFLLGKLGDADRERVETLFLTDSQLRERVDVVEQDLIDEYLDDRLTQEDREKFLLRYAQSEEQQRKLRITKSVKDWATIEARTPHLATASVSVWGRLRTLIRLRPVFIVPITAIILIAIVLAIVWLNAQKQQRQHLAIEQELARLNSPASLREVSAQMSFLEVRPVTARGVEPATELSLRAGIRLVELRLPWIQKERYSTYQAEVRRVADEQSFTIPNVRADGDGSVVRIRLPVHFLTRGQNQIQLRGIAINNSLSPPEEYSFVVSN